MKYIEIIIIIHSRESQSSAQIVGTLKSKVHIMNSYLTINLMATYEIYLNIIIFVFDNFAIMPKYAPMT